MVDRELFDAYSRALGTLSDGAEARLAETFSEIASLDAEGDYVRATALYHDAVRRFGRLASEVAREFYQRARDGSATESDYVAQQAPDVPGAFTAQDVVDARHMAVPPEQAFQWLSAKGARRVMERADYTIGMNARRDPAHPRWAIVPHPGACGWCVMVASNGWAYSERSVNAQRHNHCKCAVAADFDTGNPALEGYDPRALQEAYAKCEEAVHDEAERLWDEMSAEERKGYARKGRSAHDVFKTKMVTAEMDRRDRAWLQGPRRACSVVSEPGAEPSPSERAVGEHLASLGFSVRLTGSAGALLNGEAWELRVPEKWDGGRTIQDQLLESRERGADRLLISATESGASLSEMERRALEALDSGDYPHVREMLLMDAGGGTVVRLLGRD